ncbi:GGDEF/EAL domain-containing sensory box protein [Legionella santicrucis]|uniref:GGDEF/EAL domain-containing sensory box protein n=1 Tax=Legionella santicrucis TaxID=45074 RepID=A0A0W0Z8A7_9GAMM|nr:GGDEF domain-containing protein [Legionella santicrucis]KTD65171.1 GGDEF/EAL domain-containing sensory box protein [Legionella santicrucis]
MKKHDDAIFKYKNSGGLSDINIDQYHLIHLLTYELIICCIFIDSLYLFSKLYYLVAVISVAGILTSLNLYILIRSKNTFLCGHFVLFILFATVLIANYLVRGINLSFSAWFYVIPVLSVALVGSSGLFIYSILSILVLVGCKIFSHSAYYPLPIGELTVIVWINHLLAFVFIVSTLYSLMSERKRYEQALNNENCLLQLEKDKYHDLACFDQLTNLPNRQYFKLNLETKIASLLSHEHITLFFMDLDNFKFINDYLGHDAGDHILWETARRVRSCFQQDDFVARLGGDEFTAFVVHTKEKDISNEIIKRIDYVFKPAFHFKNQDYYCSMSIGFAIYPDQATSISELINLADQAMYEVKRGKRSDPSK